MCLKKMFNGEIIFHLKWRLRRLRYYKWKPWYKLLSSSGLKRYFCKFLSSTKHPLEAERHDILYTKYHVAAILYTGTNWKIMFSWRKVNWHELQIAKAYLVFPTGSWIVKKVLRGRRFFTVVMLHVPKISANKPYKKIVPRIFQFFQLLKTGFMSAWNFYRYEHV